MTNGLYLPGGTFQSFDALSLSTELATRDNAGTALAELGQWLALLPDPDPVLRARGEDAAILRDLSADDQVNVGMMSRKNRVLNCPHFTLRAGAFRQKSCRPVCRKCSGFSSAAKTFITHRFQRIGIISSSTI